MRSRAGRRRNRSASTKSLLVERVRHTYGIAISKGLSLQRSRSWWSESGPSFCPTRRAIVGLQRSRSWWSESGMVFHGRPFKSGQASTKSLLVERVRRKATKPTDNPPGASTKSLLVERVRLYRNRHRRTHRVASTKSLLVERVRRSWSAHDPRISLASTKSLLVERVRL